MQSFTAMRELVGSFGMLGAPQKYINNMHNNIGRDKGRYHANIFINMLQYAGNWQFNTKKEASCLNRLKPYYENSNAAADPNVSFT